MSLAAQALMPDIMPLIYNSIESEHQPVQERVLKTVPHLCEILDYGTVQNVLLVKVAVSAPRALHATTADVQMLFTRTRILTIKVQTLECFRAMVKTLDKVSRHFSGLADCRRLSRQNSYHYWRRSKPKVRILDRSVAAC